MAGDYKLIQVHADEDDVVIHAGVLPEEDVNEGLQEEAVELEEAIEVAEAVEAEPFEEPDAEAAEDAAFATAKQEPAMPAAARARKVPAQKRTDGYRETTLEDLKSEKMPLAQRIVIIAAVICLIGALAYCIMFMG